MDYCFCGSRAVARCVICGSHLCYGHQVRFREFQNSGSFACFLRGEQGWVNRGKEGVFCPDCEQNAALNSAHEIVSLLRDREAADAYALLLGAGYTLARPWQSDHLIYATIASSLDLEPPSDPLAAALDYFYRSVDPDNAPRHDVIVTYKPDPRRRPFHSPVFPPEERELIGYVEGWIIEFIDNDDRPPQGEFLLTPDGTVGGPLGDYHGDHSIRFAAKRRELRRTGDPLTSSLSQIGEAISRADAFLDAAERGERGALATHCHICAHEAARAVVRAAQQSILKAD